MVAKRVVIIGGGASGTNTAKALQGSGAKITIIQAGDFLEKQVAAPFILTCPETHESYVELLDSSRLSHVTYIVAMVLSLGGDHVIIEGGTTCYFDACVIAVGWSCGYVKPQLGESLSHRSEEVRRVGAAIRAANSVVIVGGGPVGVELAEQVRDVVPAVTSVKLVCRSGVLTNFDARTRKRMEDNLSSLNVEVLIDELRGDTRGSLMPGSYQLKSGGLIQADVLLPAYGRLQTGFLAPGLVDDIGNVIVNEYMQSVKEPKLFAVGCNTLNKFRGVPEIEDQAKTAAASLMSFLGCDAPEQELHVEGQVGHITASVADSMVRDHHHWLVALD